MNGDVRNNTKEIVLRLLGRNNVAEQIDALQETFVYLAAFPEQATEENKYLLAMAAILLKACPHRRIRSDAQVAHICECCRHFKGVFDEDFDRNNYRLFNRIAEPWSAIEEFEKNHSITSELLATLIRNWDKVKCDTYTYRFLNELLITIPRV